MISKKAYNLPNGNAGRKITIKTKELILYLIFGIITTILNILSYYIFANILNLSIVISTIIAWLLTITVAFLTNKQWVFGSICWSLPTLIKEFASFIGYRVLTGLLELAIMYVFAERLHINDMFIKMCANVVVIIANYFASRFIIFKH